MIDEQPPGADLIVPLQQFLKREELDEIRTNSTFVTHEHRELIIRQHTRTSHVMFVRSGLVKVFKEDKSKRSYMLKTAIPGEFIGLLSFYGNVTHQFSAAAIQRCEIGYIDIQTFNRILHNNGTFAVALIQTLSLEGLYIFEKLLGQSHKQLPGRIADVILYFSDMIYKNEEFDFPLTRRELAEFAGTTKESFIRTLAEFKHDRIIDLEGSHVQIKSMKIVRTLSDLG
jgi:CRP-like cAMP-binding protein